MARQFQQRRGRSSSSRGPYDDDGITESSPLGAASGNGVSEDAQDTLDDIDSLLAENDSIAGEAASLSGAGIRSAEEYGVDGGSASKGEKGELDKLGGLYHEEGNKKSLAKKASVLAQNRMKLVGGGVFGGGIIGLILAMIVMLPLKVQHIVNNLQDRFFATSEQATNDMTDRLLGYYIVHKVMPGMIDGKCSNTKITRSCAKVTPGDGPVAILYNTWRDNKFENKLATKHGIVIERYGDNKFKLITPSTLEAKGIDLGTFDANNPDGIEKNLFSSMNRTEVRREIRQAFQDETFAKRILYRYKVGKLLERKYGIVRCLVACNTRDKLTTSIEDKKLAWKGYFIDRVITPRNEMFGLALQCAMGGFDCTKNDEVDDEGDRKTQFETDVRTRIGDMNLGEKDLADLKAKAEEIGKDGFSTYLLKKLVGETMGKIIGKTVPFIGWIDLAAKLNAGVREAGPAAKKLNYIINSYSMVTMYMMYRSHADEAKTGATDAALMGAVAESLGSNAGTDQNGKGAESTPMYAEVMGSTTHTASIFSAFLPKAYAAEGYPCNDGGTIGSGVCPELNLSTTKFATEVASGLSTVYNSPLFYANGLTADFWNGTVGRLYNALGDSVGDLLASFLSHLPGYDTVEKKAGEVISAVSKWFTSWFINDMFGESPSGGRNFDIAAGGADVAGNQFCHTGLGCQKVSATAANEIRLAMENEEKEAFKHQSMFARMFNTSSKYSLISRAAIAMPTTTLTGVSQSYAGKILNPFVLAMPVVSTPATHAANSEDPFGVSQYAYPKDDPVFKTNPEKYWKDHNCDDPEGAKKWGETSTDDPATGMPENNTTYGCKLLANSANVSCAIYSTKCLTPDDLGSTQACTLSTNLAATTLPEWAEMPSVTAPVTASARGIIATATVNAKYYDTFPEVMRIISSRSPDFIATNETANETLERMRAVAPGYDAFRVKEQDDSRGNPAQSMNNSILWRTDKWEMLQGGRVKVVDDDQVIFNGGQKIWDRFATWGIFKRKTDGAIVSFISTHFPTNPTKTRQWGDQPFSRAQQYGLGMDVLIQLTQVLGQHGPVVVGGDMNTHGEEGDWAAEPKMKAAGFDFVKDRGVIYTFSSPGTKITGSNIVTVPLKDDHGNQALFAKIDLNNATPFGSDSVAPTSTDGCSSTTGSKIHVATFNIFHSTDSKESWMARLHRSMDVLTDPANAIDVAGLQEVRPDQLATFKTAEFGGNIYDVYPAATKNPEFSPNPIIWKKDRFELVKTYGVPFTYFNGMKTKAPMVKLKDKTTGQEFYFVNTHDPADVEGEEAILYRYQNAKAYAEYFADLKQDGLPIIFTGDFNSGYRVIENTGSAHDGNNTYQDKRENLTYCILTKDVFNDSYDVFKNKSGTCPSKGVDLSPDGNNANVIDHIFVNKGLGVTKYWHAAAGKQKNGSDVHPTIMAEVAIGGDDSGSGGNNSATPGKGYFGPDGLGSGNCVDYVKHVMAKHFPGYNGGAMGDGADFAANFGRTFRLTVNHTPAVHAIVSFPRSMADPVHGHVAIVAEVRKDGSIVVEEFNWTNSNHYGTHVVSADKVGKLTYAHTEGKIQ